ncbi:MAG: M20/M25/M40 family metallo-hydrolase [Gemmatimonadota bacterium]
MILSKSAPGPRGLTHGLFLALLLPGLGVGSSAALAQGQPACPVPETLTGGIQGPMAHVRYLADDALEGREVGTPGARCAADYIAAYFRGLGLEGAGPGGSFFQSFEVRMGSVLGEGNSFSVSGKALTLQEDWTLFGFSSSGALTAPLIYGGAGVSQPGSEDDRYAHLDLEGKIVVVEAADPHGSGANTMAGDPHFKATVAAGRGAAAVVVLLPERESLPDPVAEQRPALKIPAVAISGRLAQELREAAEANRSVELAAAIVPRMVEALNVVALIAGAGPTVGREVMVVGAHYDHLGLGGDGSLAPDARVVHNGADDNASGTAALMEVARRIKESGRQPSRSILFLAFTGEEKGLWGSGHYVKEPLLPIENTVAMMNMDMVGRLRENTLTVYGTGTAEEWPTLLEELNRAQEEPFVLASIPDGFGPSDHSSFYGADIPVLMLFTNTHAEYHRPEDDWQTINQEGMERVASFAADIVAEVTGSSAARVMAVTLVEGAGNPHGGGMPADQAAPASPGYGAYMGTIPDMTPQEFGVRITGVREESPAEKAGLQGGDTLVEFGGKEITDLYAYTYALREHKPGDEVTVVVLRDGERVTLTVVLGSR